MNMSKANNQRDVCHLPKLKQIFKTCILLLHRKLLVTIF